ncbi:ATP-binding protein [Kitasatospora sp. NPDC056327]|uniref:ATP-binding protein n=1 Tax=Kitasatospora sp. NPDC056327 TaxID=3345785 RepID=UPI0035D84009
MSTLRGQGPDGPADEPHLRSLAAAVAAVLARVDAHVAVRSGRPAAAPPTSGPPAPGPSAPEPPELPGQRPPVTALDVVTASFGLTPFEREVLVLAAAPAIDPTADARCAAAAGDPGRAHPTFSLALAALERPHWSALAPVGPLRRFRLVEPEDETALTASRLRIDERVLHFLVGVPYLDVRLHGLLTRVGPPGGLPDPHERCAARLARVWTAAEPAGPPHTELTGADRRTRWEVAAAAADRAGLGLYAVHRDDLPTGPAERERLARLWQREAILIPAALLVEAGEPAGERPHARHGAEAFLASLAVPLVVSGDEPPPAGAPDRTRVTVPPLGPEDQLAVWAAALDGAPGVTDGGLRALAAQFSLPGHLIRSAAATARREAASPAGREAGPATDRGAGPTTGPEAGVAGEGTGTARDITALAWHAGLAEARMSLDELGRRVEPRAGWEDLVLEERQRATLREIVAHVRRRGTVYQEWGFESVLRRGLGVTALFAGGSGTGKTLAAEVVAGQLGVDLFVIDLSQVVSKYIGETEKNLRRVFDAAERGGALLLFDEADALFGKRSEIRDSHDRYANLEVSYLLMRMEAYRGLAVLTTNMKKALDPAFMRRIRFVVDFPFPGVPERAEIWRRVIPGRTPSQGLDPERLAQLTVAGGSIRNIALSAAFQAADEDCPVQMRHLLAAAHTEYRKLERSLTPSEVGGWI